MSAETNWEVICSELNERLTCDTSELDATQQLEYYYKSCLEAVKAGAPMRKKPKNFKGIPIERKRLMQKRVKLRKQLEKCTNIRKRNSIKLNIIQTERKMIQAIDKSRHTEERKAIGMIKSDPRAFYNFAKKKGVIGKSIGPLKSDNGQLIRDPKCMSNMLNKQYDKVFNRAIHNPHIVDQVNMVNQDDNEISLNNFFENDNAPLSNVSFTSVKVTEAIAKIKLSSASGPDKICPLFLKKTSHISAEFLSDLMNKPRVLLTKSSTEVLA